MEKIFFILLGKIEKNIHCLCRIDCFSVVKLILICCYTVAFSMTKYKILQPTCFCIINTLKTSPVPLQHCSCDCHSTRHLERHPAKDILELTAVWMKRTLIQLLSIDNLLSSCAGWFLLFSILFNQCFSLVQRLVINNCSARVGHPQKVLETANKRALVPKRGVHVNASMFGHP